jgi:thioredoxin reductase
MQWIYYRIYIGYMFNKSMICRHMSTPSWFCHRRGGIKVDGCLRTSDPNIYAVGEVASHDGMVYGLWKPGSEQAEAGKMPWELPWKNLGH